MICPRCNNNTLRIIRDYTEEAYCSSCRFRCTKSEYIDHKHKKRVLGILPMKAGSPPPVIWSFDRWVDELRTKGASNCSCGHPGGGAPCYWCTEGAYQEYEAWCVDNQQQPEYDTPINRTNSQGNNSMQLNRKNFAEFFRTDFYTVGVKFFGAAGDTQAKEYTYKVHKDMEICIGDKVFVCTSNDPMLAQELKATVVSSINREPELEGSDCINYKWIVGKLQDVLAPYLENIDKDNRLKRAVTVLERKLEQINLRKSIALAMEELGDEDKNELKSLFGTELLGPAQITEEKKDA